MKSERTGSRRPLIEWPTLLLLCLCYGGVVLGTTWASALWLPLGILFCVPAMVLHSSLSHEVVHGHPFRSQFLSELMVFPAIGLFVPYLRFKDTHLAHHTDANLTDPYDDPESNYMDPEVWRTLPDLKCRVLRFNNTLIGRILIGPTISMKCCIAEDIALVRGGDRRVLLAWLLHGAGVALVLTWLMTFSAMPIGVYMACAYLAFGILKIRTFLEHQAHHRYQGRTVIIEDNGPLAWLFLYNSLHVVHHMHPRLPWYRLSKAFNANRARYLGRNEGYYFKSYWTILRRFLFTAKDPVPHPHWPKQ